MSNEIPHIAYNPRDEILEGFEIVPIHKIAKERPSFKHDPAAPHQLDFYNLIVFTEGEGRHFIDFNWHPVKKGSVVYLAKEQINAFDLDSNL
ncbi:MAG: AraC family ligand binding domain-containing protein, partial [Crocinitomicaceae bacterium]